MRTPIVALVGVLILFSCAAWSQYYEGLQDPWILELGGPEYPGLEPGVCGGTIYVSTRTNPKKWNPATAAETGSLLFTNQMFRRTHFFHPITGALTPGLSTHWDVSDDGLTVTFHLRRGVKWSDGVEFTSADVLFTYNDVILNEDVECQDRDALRLPNGQYPVMTAPDPYTVRVEVSQVFRPILSSLMFAILPEHVLADELHKRNPAVPRGHFNEAWGLDTDPSELVGLGPFLLESYVADQHVIMKRNPHYYAYDQNGTQLPYVDRYVVLIVGGQDAELLKFRNGELDALNIRAVDVPVLIPEATANGFEVMVGDNTYGTSWLALNQDYGLGEEDPAKDNLRGLFRDLRFRQALKYATDKPSIIENVFNGLAAPQWSPVSVPSPFYAGRDGYGGPITDADAVFCEYDLDEAVALLDEIGILDSDGDGIREFSDGRPVEFLLEIPAGNTVILGCMMILADDLAKIGVQANVQPVAFPTLVTRLMGGLYQAVAAGLTGGNEPNDGSNVYRTSGGLHFWHYSAATDPYPYEQRINELFDLGVSTFDNDEAFAYYKEFQILYATQDLGLLYAVNQRFTYVCYDYVGNREIAGVYVTPSAGAWEICWLKGER